MTEHPSSNLCAAVLAPSMISNTGTLVAVADAISPAVMNNKNLSASQRSVVTPSSQVEGTNNCSPRFAHPSLSPFTVSGSGPAASVANSKRASPKMNANTKPTMTKKKAAKVSDGVASFIGSTIRATSTASPASLSAAETKANRPSAAKSPSKNNASPARKRKTSPVALASSPPKKKGCPAAGFRKSSPSKIQKPPANKSQANKKIPSVPGKVLAGDAMVRDHNDKLERCLQGTESYQDSLINDYLDKKYEECVLMKPVAGFHNIRSRTTGATMLADLVGQPVLGDIFGEADLLLSQQNCHTLGLAGPWAPCPSVHSEPTFGQEDRMIMPPPQFIFADSEQEDTPKSHSPPAATGVVSNDERKMPPGNSCKFTLQPSDAMSIETIEKGVSSDDYTPIDLCRASSDDLYKALLGMGSRSASLEDFSNGCANEMDEEVGGFSQFAVPPDQLSPTHTKYMNKMLARVTPDAATEHFRYLDLLPAETVIDHYMPSFFSEHSFKHHENDQLTFMLPPPYVNTIFPEDQSSLMIDNDGGFAHQVLVSTDQKDTRAYGTPSEQRPQPSNDDFGFHFQFLDENPMLYQGGYHLESGTTTDLALGQQQGYFSPDSVMCQWIEQPQDHRDFGNGRHCQQHTSQYRQDEDTAGPYDHHPPIQAPKRVVSFVNADVTLSPGVNDLQDTSVEQSQPGDGSEYWFNFMLNPSKQAPALAKVNPAKKEKKAQSPSRSISNNSKRSSSKNKRTSVKAKVPHADTDVAFPKLGDEEGDEIGDFSELQNENWMKSYFQFKAFVKQNGTSIIPGVKGGKNARLARWAKRQRQQYKLFTSKTCKQPTGIDQRRIDFLNKAGFIWDTQLHLWKTRLSQLKEYIAVYGSVDGIPKGTGGSNNLTDDNRERNQILGWIKTQRNHYQTYVRGGETPLDAQRVELLDSIQFPWCAPKNSDRQETNVTTEVAPIQRY